MYNWWMYIRAMFEEKYASKNYSFHCTKQNVVNEKTKCICIPCVAVNYIANVIKFLEHSKEKSSGWRFMWFDEDNVYLVRKGDGDWNKDLYDIQSPGKVPMAGVRLCEKELNKYAYIKIRDQKIIERSPLKPRQMLYSLPAIDTDSKIEIEIYTIMARDFRMEFPMEEYIDKLFRFWFILQPLKCLEVIAHNMEKSDSRSLREYNAKLLDEYEILIDRLKEIRESKEEENIHKILEQIGKFVGVRIWTIYIYLKESEEHGGSIQSIDDLLQKKMNSILKMKAKGKESRINRLREKYLLIC